MESIGAYLKRQREMRKIGLEEISQTTKISMKCLVAIEIDDFNALPGFVFAKGFIRSYAKAIGLDEEEALLHFEDYLETVLDSPHRKKTRFRWLHTGGLQLKPWAFFILLLVIVVVIAYLSS